MVLRNGGRGADEIEVGLHRNRLERHGAAIPGLAEVAADLVAVGRDGALDPLDPADRAALAGKAREDAAPARLARFLLRSVEKSERRDLHGEDRGVGAGAAILHHADLVAVERRGEQLQPSRRRREGDDRLDSSVAVGSDAGLRRGRVVAVATVRASQCESACNRKPLLGGPARYRPEAERECRENEREREGEPDSRQRAHQDDAAAEAARDDEHLRGA